MSRERSAKSTAHTERFAALYESHHTRLVGYCRRRVSADIVDDLVAEVFLVAWRRIDAAPVGDSALPWLYRIAYNVTGNHWRGRNRRKRLVEKLGSLRSQPSQSSVSYQIEARQEIAEVLMAAQKLSPADAEILRLAHWEELSVNEIAVVLDITSNTAKQRLWRARQRLGDEYGQIVKTSGTRADVDDQGGER